ncbi:protein SYS1 homolog isoform X2 [Saccoglossus kowalevskii]|uniref:Protein SYS1 homolog n=1 Tax=Saccoglossus kowalevskii TaxID=10224 RepID=A0ABM0H1Z0_SACKO|nr:PREDICTED: protein SYS1 homolog isoform X1 [Saccoglossus kowalevskii]
MSGSFRTNIWDPGLIIAQMLALQSIYYFFLGLWLVLVDCISQASRSVDQMFSYEDLEFKSFNGKLIMIAFVLNSLTGAGGLWLLISRTRQCLDFAATVHLYHLIVCWIYNGSFPMTLSWWLVNVACLALMTVLGEFLCMRSEMTAIPVSVGAKSDL